MDVSRVSELITAIENGFSVHEFVEQELSVWPIIKSVIIGNASSNSTTKSQSKSGYVRQLAKGIRNRLRSWLGRFSNVTPNSHANALVFVPAHRRHKRDGKTVDLYAEPLDKLIQELGYQCHIVSYGAPHMDYWRTDYSIEGQMKWRMAGKSKSASSGNWQRDLKKFSRSEFDIELPMAKIQNSIAYALSSRDLFRDWIAKSQISTAFMVPWYDRLSFGLTAACKESGVTVVDLGHGIPGLNYQIEKSVDLDLLNTFPDRFWVWSKSIAERLAQLNGEAFVSRILIGGNLQLLLEESKGGAAVTRDSVLVTTLPTIDDEEINLINQLRSKLPAEIKVVVRPHPRMSANTIASVSFDKGIDIVTSNQELVRDRLSKSFVHITSWSSTALEAEQLGVPTVFTRPKEAELYFKDILPPASYKVARSAEDLCLFVNQFLSAASHVGDSGEKVKGNAEKVILGLLGMERS